MLDGSLMTVEVTAALVCKENNNHKKKQILRVIIAEIPWWSLTKVTLKFRS